jgi:acetyl esterase|tara:strand:+ start:288 stop:1277 length:990 start_codon:yes stop_codon:yes gene_type:complete
MKYGKNRENAMPLNQQAQIVLDMIAKAEANGAPRTGEIEAHELREIYKSTRSAYTPKVPELELVEELSIPGVKGNIPARFYRPILATNQDKLPVLIYFHGGGWTIGDIDTHDPVCRLLADSGKFSVLNVGYRLAPENKFPAAVEDAWSAYNWVVDGQGDYLGIDTGAISVGGDSAGGNLATVVSIMARDAKLNLICQALIYPATSFYIDSDSQREFAEGYFLTREGQKWYHSQYLGSDEDRDNWKASPIFADSLEGLAPAYILTCGFDPLRDDGLVYSERLKKSGVEVVYRCFEGQIHGFITMGGIIDETIVAINEVASFVSSQYQKIE